MVRRALVALTVAAVAACYNDSPEIGPGAVVTVRVSFGDSVVAVGDTTTFSAQGLDQSQAFVVGLQATWASDAPNVATVDPNTGLVTGCWARGRYYFGNDRRCHGFDCRDCSIPTDRGVRHEPNFYRSGDGHGQRCAGGCHHERRPRHVDRVVGRNDSIRNWWIGMVDGNPRFDHGAGQRHPDRGPRNAPSSDVHGHRPGPLVGGRQ